MDPKRAKELLDELCEGIARKKAALKRGAGVVGVGVAVGLVGLSMGCGDEEELGKADVSDTAAVSDGQDIADEEVPLPVDLYGIMMDTVEPQDTSELPPPVDAYGVPVDAMDAGEPDLPPVDLYGVPVDAG